MLLYCERAKRENIEKANFVEKPNLEKMAGPVGGPLGLGGFGDVGEARMNFNRMSERMHRLKEISENVEADQLNIEKYVKELTDVVREMFMSTGSMFQQESLRVLSTLAMQGGGGYGTNGRPQRPSWSTRSSSTYAR